MPTKDKKYNAKLVDVARAAKLAPMPKVTPSKPCKGDKFIFKSDVIERSGYSYPTIWKRMRDGTFPRCVAVGGRVAWFESQFLAWMKSQPLRRFKGDA
jgi:predicted DNA-binding transcriptional regulator AlpA